MLPVFAATTPGDCRMPTPIVNVTSSSAAFHGPRCRGNRLGSDVAVRSLVEDRFRAAAGLVVREPA